MTHRRMILPLIFLTLLPSGVFQVAATADASTKKKAVAAWVGIDDKGVTTKGYRIRTFPTVVLIDPDGVVQGVTDPESVTTAMVKDLANRRPLQLSPDAVPRLRTDAGGGIDLGR